MKKSCKIISTWLFIFCGIFAMAQEEEVFGSLDKKSEGFRGQVYLLQENTGTLPTNFEDLESVATLYTKTLDISSRSWTAGFPGVKDRFEWFAIEYKTTFYIKEPGKYQFRLHSDDGSKLFIDGAEVVNNDGTHGPSSARGEMSLSKGKHKMTVQYFQGPRVQIALQFFYNKKEETEAIFPGEDIELKPPGGKSWWPILIVLLLAAGGAQMVRRNVNRPHVRVEWVHPDRHRSSPQGNYYIEGRKERILPVRWDTSADVQVNVWVTGGWTKKKTIAGNISLAAIDPVGRSNAIIKGCDALKVDASGRGSYTIKQIDLLRAAGIYKKKGESSEIYYAPNLGAISLDAHYSQKPLGVSGRTKCHLYPMLRRVVMLLPGAPGTEIKLKDDRDENAFPEWGGEELSWLKCDRQGILVQDAENLKLFENFLIGLSHIYDIQELEPLYKPINYPKLIRGKKSETSIPYFLLKPWPYDWRLHLEKHVKQLTGTAQGKSPKDEPTVAPPWSIPPSMDAILKAAKKNDETKTLSDKAIVVAHSTGGLVVRSALGLKTFADKVERAFFLNVPFWGAPKAYDTYLSGDMGIPFLKDESLRLLVPNIPVFYYLAPSKSYPDPIVKDYKDGKWIDYSRKTSSAGELMGMAIAKKRHYGPYPQKGKIDEWNKTLEAQADAFHDSLYPARTLSESVPCHVFVSEGNPETKNEGKTIAGLELVPKRGTRRVGNFYTDGDGTVPRVSQRADWAKKQIIEIPNNPEHVACVIEKFVWEKIVEVLYDNPPKK